MTKSLLNVLASKLTYMINPEHYSLREFAKKASSLCKNNVLVLDAGAGWLQYAKYFKHCRYIPLDITTYPQSPKPHIIADLSNSPIKNDIFDYIICFQVLEHSFNVEEILAELNRVIRPGGYLFLTVPQSWQLHAEPNDFFRFTPFSLEKLLSSAGFTDINIEPRGGAFWLIGRIACSVGEAVKNKIARPFALFMFSFLIPLIMFRLDFLDGEKKWTMGYQCVCRRCN